VNLFINFVRVLKGQQSSSTFRRSELISMEFWRGESQRRSFSLFSGYSEKAHCTAVHSAIQAICKGGERLQEQAVSPTNMPIYTLNKGGIKKSQQIQRTRHFFFCFATRQKFLSKFPNSSFSATNSSQELDKSTTQPQGSDQTSAKDTAKQNQP
jgi:hypothetical protein